jgi:hypothetical protein
MNAADILRYGQHTVLQAIDGIEDERWDLAGACGVWSMKDIVAHLTSYERVLEDILGSLQGATAAPYLERFQAVDAAFNDSEVERRRGRAAREVLEEFGTAHGRTLELLAAIPEDKRREPGTLPWYGAEYALDDVIVYMYYGHKREHSAQIAVFRDRLRVAPPLAPPSGARR